LSRLIGAFNDAVGTGGYLTINDKLTVYQFWQPTKGTVFALVVIVSQPLLVITGKKLDKLKSGQPLF